MVARTTRLTLLTVLVLILGGVAWVGTHPGLLAPWLARQATRHLLRNIDGNLRIRDIEGNPLSGMEFRDVVFSLRGKRGALLVAAADTLDVSYDLGDLLHGAPRFASVRAAGLEVRIRRSRPPDPDEPVVPGGPFRLPHLRIDDLAVHRATIAVSGPTGKAEEEIDRLSCEGSLRAESALTLVVRDLDADWATRDSRVRDLRGLVTVDDAAVAWRQLTARINDSDVATDGSRTHDGRLDVQVHASHVSTPEIENLLDTTLGFAANGDADLHVTSLSDTLALEVGFRGDLEGYTVEGLQGSAVLSPTELVWDHIEGRLNDAWFSGSGLFDVTDPQDVSYVLEGAVADVDLSRGLVPDTELPETGGWGHLHLWHRDRTQQTQVRGWLRDGFVAAVPFDSLAVDLDADRAGVDFHALDMRYAAQRASLTGHADPDGAFRGNFTVDAPELSRLPGTWRLPPLHGALAAAGEVTGSDPNYDLRGDATLHGAGLRGLDADSCRVAFTIDDALGSPRIVLEFAGGGLDALGVPLDDFSGDADVDAKSVELAGFRAARGDTTLALSGRAELHDGIADIVLPQLDLNLEGNRWRLDEPARISTGPGLLRVDSASLASDYGSIVARGVWDRGGKNLDGDVLVDRFDMNLVDPFLPEGRTIGGRLSADLSLGGSPDEPLLGLEARLEGYASPVARVDTMSVAALFYENTLDIRSLRLVTNYGRVRVAGTAVHPHAELADFWPGAGLDLSVDVTDGDWAFLEQFKIPSLERLAGSYDASLTVTGDTRHPVIAGGVESRPFNVHWLHLDELAGNVGYRDGTLTLGDLRGRKETLPVRGRIEVPLQLDLLGTAVSPPDGPMVLSVTVPDGTDLTPLSRTCNAFVETGGEGGLSVVVSGPADHPYYDGRISVRDGSCVLRGLSEVYSGVSCDGEWNGDVLRLSGIEGREGARGTLSGQGTVTFDGLGVEGFDVKFDADRFLVASIPDLRALVRGKGVELTGVKVGPDSLIVPKFTGDLQVIEARYTGDFSEQPSISDPRVATVAPDWLADLDLAAPPRSGRIINRTMELFLGGDVRLVRDMEGLSLRGRLSIDQGRLPVFNNDFKVTRGSLDFSREVGVIPQVDMTAETSVRLPAIDNGSRRLEKIYVDVTGSAMEPQVQFRSESGYSRSNIERMLLGLSPYATDVQTNSAIRQGTMAAGFNLLEREVATELDVVDTFDIESGRIRENGTTQTLIGVGKYIGRDLYVKFAQAVTDQDREVLVEYQMTDHLLLQSEVSRRADEALGDTTYNVDLKYRFEY